MPIKHKISTFLAMAGADRLMDLQDSVCAGFPAGTGDAHRLVNRSGADVLLLVVGDHGADDEIAYPDIDMQARLGAGGTNEYARKDGTPY